MKTKKEQSLVMECVIEMKLALVLYVVLIRCKLLFDIVETKTGIYRMNGNNEIDFLLINLITTCIKRERMIYSKTCVKRPLKNRQNKALMTNGIFSSKGFVGIFLSTNPSRPKRKIYYKHKLNDE